MTHRTTEPTPGERFTELMVETARKQRNCDGRLIGFDNKVHNLSATIKKVVDTSLDASTLQDPLREPALSSVNAEMLQRLGNEVGAYAVRKSLLEHALEVYTGSQLETMKGLLLGHHVTITKLPDAQPFSLHLSGSLVGGGAVDEVASLSGEVQYVDIYSSSLGLISDTWFEADDDAGHLWEVTVVDRFTRPHVPLVAVIID